MSLYESLAETAEGRRGLAVVRLINELQGALCEAVASLPEGRRKSLLAKETYELIKGDRSDLTIEQVARQMHDLGKEIMITVVPAGESRRIAEQEMAEVADRQSADKGLKETT